MSLTMPAPTPTSKSGALSPAPNDAVSLNASAAVPAFDVKNLSIWYGEKKAIKNITIEIPSKTVTAIIGPSGCGKSTFLRCLNRMHELVPHTRVDGEILFHGENLY